MLQTLDAIENGLIAVGTVFGIANVDTILGIIMLSIQVILLIIKLAIKIFNSVKKGESLDYLDDDIGSVIDGIEDVIDEIKEHKEEKELNDGEHK